MSKRVGSEGDDAYCIRYPQPAHSRHYWRMHSPDDPGGLRVRAWKQRARRSSISQSGARWRQEKRTKTLRLQTGILIETLAGRATRLGHALPLRRTPAATSRLRPHSSPPPGVRSPGPGPSIARKGQPPEQEDPEPPAPSLMQQGASDHGPTRKIAAAIKTSAGGA